jgi:translation initiation factor eIF-2B subunit delta
MHLKSLTRYTAQVIQDYATPTGTTLSRHLSAHLSPQITYLVQARPMAASMGNAIRNLKYEISILSIDLPEQDVSVRPTSVEIQL